MLALSLYETLMQINEYLRLLKKEREIETCILCVQHDHQASMFSMFSMHGCTHITTDTTPVPTQWNVRTWIHAHLEINLMTGGSQITGGLTVTVMQPCKPTSVT